MQPDIGDLFLPVAGLSMERFQLANFQTMEEVLLDVTDGVLYPPLLISSPNITGHQFKAIVSRKVQVARIKGRRLAGETLQYRAFEIVMHHPASAAAEVFQRVAMAGQEALHALAQEELHKKEPAITQDRHEVMQFAQSFSDAHQPMSAPVNLEAIARFEGEF